MERLNLTKAELLEIVDNIMHRWGKNRKANAKYIFAMGLFRVALVAMPEEDLIAVWSEIHKTFNEIYLTQIYKLMDGEVNAPQLKKLWFGKMRAERDAKK